MALLLLTGDAHIDMCVERYVTRVDVLCVSSTGGRGIHIGALTTLHEEVLWLVHRSASRHVVGQSGQGSPSSNPLLAFILVHGGARGATLPASAETQEQGWGVSTSPQVAKLVVMMYVNCEMWYFLRQLSEVSSSSKSS